jgi:diguanylate cyclase (GGDEF)-like protein/PAS domain S-box-containing protein
MAQVGPTSATASVRRGEARQSFWEEYLRSGLALLAVETAALFGYLLLTPHGPHRLMLKAVAVIVVTIAITLVPFVPRLAASAWRAPFAVTLSLLACVTLAVCAALDGGVDSTPLVLITLPVMWAGVGLPSRAVAGCGLAALAEVATIATGDRNVGAPFQHDLLLFALVVGAAALAYVSSRNRARVERKEASLAGELAWLAETDGLTGCLNQRAFERSIGAEVDRALRHHEPLSLLVADVDLLKSLNDAQGHPAGDAALTAVGTVLRTSIRSFDLAARIGGDEFAVILPNTSLAGADMVARRIAAALDAAATPVTLSIGVAALDPTAPTAKRLVRDADAAMYVAKANGRHGVESAGGFRESHVHLDRAGSKPTVTLPEDRDRLEEQLRRADRETAQATTILDTLLTTAPVGFGFVDRDFRIVRINETLAAINGSTVNDQVGRTVAQVVPKIWPTLQPVYQRVLDTGTAVINLEMTADTAADPDHEHHWLNSFYPVRVDDEIIGIGIVIVDITDRKNWELKRAAFTHNAVGALAATIDARDPYTAGHQRAVANLAAAIAAELGQDTFAIEGIHLAATIHDIGKIAIPSEILNRPGRLTDIEMELVKTHSQIGYDILAGVEFPWPVREMVLQHHERLDGSGYPNGLRGEQILLGARIIAVADLVDAMSSHRPYRPAVGLDAAIQALESGRGQLFDPVVVDACLRVIHNGYVLLPSTFKDRGSCEPVRTVAEPRGITSTVAY